MNHLPRSLGLPSRLALAIGLAFASCGAWAQTASETELARKLDQLAQELANVKAQLSELKQQRAQMPTPAPAPSVASAAPAPLNATVASPAEPATVLTSYGEINYTRPTRSSQDQNTQADISRFVLGYQHRFDDRTKVVTELEVEHAVSSADDPGEVEVEQAYVERQLSPTWAARGGLFLIPMGLLNENHEPTAYYGVQRNFVETAIIPTTWREGGVQFVGNFDNGITLQTGLTTGFDISKWDATSTEGAESPLGAIHQEMALAKSRDLSIFGTVNWRGVPGLLVGGGVFTGGVSQKQAVVNSRVTLADLHARWTPGRWDLSALYAWGMLSNTAALNTPLVGNPTLIPRSFDGGYLQAAYQLWRHDDYLLAPFARIEQYNTARTYADLGAGLTPAAAATERVLTVGANFQINPNVVLKADYQRFHVNQDADRIDLGLGWSF